MAGAVELLAVAGLAALFFWAVMFRQGTFVYLFHKASTAAWIDEGVRVAAGEAPYRDFLDRVGPGILYLNAALARAFGARVDTFAWAGVAVGCLLTVALHAVAGAIVRGPWRLAPPAAFAVLVYPPFDLGHPKWPALLLAWCAVGIALHARDRTGPLLAAGVACGLAIAFTPVVGFAVLAGLALHLTLEARRRRRSALTALAAGAVAATALTALLLAAHVGTAALSAGLGPVRAARPIVLLPGRWTALNVAWLALALASVVAAKVSLRGAAEPGERLVAQAGLALLAATAAGYVDGYAVAVQGTLLTVAAAAGAARLTAYPLLRRALAVALAGGLLAAGAAQVWWRQRVQPLTRQQFRAGAAWIGAPNLELPWIEERTQPGDSTFVFPAGGGSFFLTRTRNATSLPYVIEGQASLEDQGRALAEIEAAHPPVGVWMGGQRVTPERRGVPLDTLYDGILRSYQPERTLPDGTLLLRRR
jgi:hypothetical protein